MACPGESILTYLGQKVVDKTIKEIRYFCDFEDNFLKFQTENDSLVAKLNKVNKDIEDAKNIRNEDRIEDDVRNWMDEANHLIRENTQIRETRSYSCHPCWKYRHGKKLAKRILAIRDHIQKWEFDRVARPAELPGMKYHAPTFFIEFESRKTKFNQLMKALKDGNHYMIGLQGMGGTGKTTLATQVGKQVEESKEFEKVIFVVVSNPPDVNQIRGDIAGQLGFELVGKSEAEHSKSLWSRISTNEKKLLIILDDMWGELDLREIGIPLGEENKNCYVLITTRDSEVCNRMRCQPIVHLQTLGDEEAMKLFMSHATRDDDVTSITELEGLARDFLKECGGLPIAIVALASTLRNWPTGERHVALSTLRSNKPFVNVSKDLVKVYKCLKLSYDCINDDDAQKLFLSCSIFPEDYEIPIDLIIRIGIASGIFEKFDDYCSARSQAFNVKNKLIASSLLLKVEEKGCVKMHDLVREAAQWIAKEDIQVIVDSRMTLKADKQFAFWSAGDFPDQCDNTKVEILLLWIRGNFLEKDPNAFFKQMSMLKVLFLLSECDKKVPSPSLSQSLLSLKNIHTLILDSWEIGDISILKKLRSLVTLELKNCLIFELPIDFMQLKKLRWLGLRGCEIQKNNPFKVIERCSQLEEFYFVDNGNVKDWSIVDGKEIEEEIAHNKSSPKLDIFSIAYDGFKRFANDDNSLLRCFNPSDMEHLIPDAMFRYLVGSAEVLELRKKQHARWKNLSPDVIPLGNRCMDNLIKLYLYEWDDIECLIDCSNKDQYSNITSFSKLVELDLYGVDLKKLYLGTMPLSFLWKLQVLKLKKCMQLQNIFLDENIKLPHLKVLVLKNCPMFQPSIFQLSAAQCLKQLEELEVEDCKELKCLIAYEGSEQKMTDVLFPELKSLQISRCDKLEIVLPLFLSGDLPKLKYLSIYGCEDLKFIFGEYGDASQVFQQEIILPSLTKVDMKNVPSLMSIFQKSKMLMPSSSPASKEDLKEKHDSSKTGAFLWVYGCCFRAADKDIAIGVSRATSECHPISKGSSKRMETLHPPVCLMSQPFILQNIKELRLVGCAKLKSLFNISIATTIMLEKLYISRCEELKHLITHEAEDDDHLKCTSIFPKLQSLEIWSCNKLEFILSSTLSGGLQNLKSINIESAEELKYMFRRYDDEECVSHGIENNESHIHLPALESLCLWNVPNMISIGINEYQQKCSSLEEAPQGSNKRMETLHSPVGLMSQPFILQNIKELTLVGCSKLKSLFNASIATTIMLKKLHIHECEELKHLITHEAEDDDHLKCTSIFPKLQMLEIYNCNKLEFIFPSTLSGGLQNLKSIMINGAEELKYVFGRYDDEECISHGIENNESHVHLPALESLNLRGVPNMISIGTKRYQQKCPSLQIVKEASQMQDVTSDRANESEVLEIVAVETPPTPTVSVLFQYFLNFHNLKTLSIGVNQKLKTLFTISECRILPQLSQLSIDECSELVCVVEDGSVDNHQMNYSSIFPKLENLYIWNCNKLEFIFPLSFSDSLQKLKYLTIKRAAELKGLFKNENDELHIHLSTTLESLSFSGVPKIMNKIFENKYHLSFLSLQSIKLRNLQEFKGRSFLDLMASLQGMQLNVKVPKDFMKIMKDVQKLTGLALNDSKIEEVVNLEGVEIEGEGLTLSLERMLLQDHCELRHIWNGPKYIMSLPNLRKLSIIACKKLRVIFSVSIVKSLPQLWWLNIQDCDELVDIIEESDEHPLQHQLCFPKLKELYIKRCNSLKHLFSISTCGMFPMLEDLNIEEAYEMEQVFIHKQYDIQNMTKMKRVFPNLSNVTLTNLPRLITICQGIDFQALKCQVDGCPNYKEAYYIQQETEDGGSENQVATNASPNFAERNKERVKEIEAKDPAPVLLEKQPELRSTSLHNFEETEKKDGKIVPLRASSSIQILETSKEVAAGTTSESLITKKIKDPIEQGLEQKGVARIASESSVTTTTLKVSSMKETHVEEGFKGDKATQELTIPVQLFDSESRKQPKVSPPISQITQSTKDTKKQALEVNHAEEDATTSSKSINSDSALFGKETEDGSKVQEEVEPEKPLNPALPQVIPSLQYQSQVAEAGISSPKLGICEIFKLVELKHGETALLAQALEQYPRLVLPREHRTHRIIAWSYRVLVDILVILATKTPNAITPSEKSTLEANLSEAIVLGFDKDWVESVRVKVFGDDMSDISKAKQEIQVMEMKLREIDEDRQKLMKNMNKLRNIVSAKDKPFGI